MTASPLNERDLEFLLHEFLDTEVLLQRPRYAERDLDVFRATLSTARAVVVEYLAPHNLRGEVIAVDGGQLVGSL